MFLTPPQFRTLKTVLRYGQEQIEEAESIIGGIRAAHGKRNRTARPPQRNPPRIEDERRSVEQLDPSGGRHERADPFLFAAG